jgi:hypothetical protein
MCAISLALEVTLDLVRVLKLQTLTLACIMVSKIVESETVAASITRTPFVVGVSTCASFLSFSVLKPPRANLFA